MVPPWSGTRLALPPVCGTPPLLILTLKLRAVTSVARLSRLSSKLRYSALEVYINAISKPVLTLLNM